MRSFVALFLCVFLSLGGVFAQRNVELSKAASLEAEGKWQEAASIYKDLLKRQKSEQLYMRLFNSLLNSGDTAKAEGVLKDAIDDFPRGSNFSVRLFLLYNQTNRQKKAEKQFEKILKTLRADNSDIVSVGNAFLALGYIDKAEQVFVRGQKLLGNPNAYDFQLGSIYLQRGDYGAIARQYLSRLEQQPESLAQVEAGLAGLLAKDSLNLLPTVEKAWGDIYKRQGSNPNLSRFGLWLYLQGKRYDKALEMARTIDRKFDSGSGEGLIELAQSLSQSGEDAFAAKAYSDVLKKGETCVYYDRALIGSTDILYRDFLALPSDKKTLNKLLAAFDEVFSRLGYREETCETVLQAAEIMAVYNNQAQEAVDLLDSCASSNAFSNASRAEFKLLSAELYHRFGDSWQATLLCSQVEKDMKNSPLSDRAKFYKAVISFQNGEIEWSLSQFKALRASTTKLIANDALEYSVLIEENRDEDSSFAAMRLYAAAERERDWGNYDAALGFLDSIRSSYLYHPLLDECLYLEALIAKDRGDWQRADSLLKNLLLKYPYELTSDDALMQLASIAETFRHSPEEAKQYYEQLILDYPNSLYVAPARKKLRTLNQAK